MEVHAHSHTARKKWTHYLWEFLMLFLAVFCGFLAEYQLEHKIEKERGKEYIHSMVEDLAEDTLTLAASINELDPNVKRMDSLIYLLSSADVKSYGADLYSLGRQASRGSTLALHDRTIQQMKNSGGFRLINNEMVSKAIIEYYNQLRFIDLLEATELNETTEYRKMAIQIFHPVIFDGTVMPDDNIAKPAGNPALLTYDAAALLHLGGMVAYLKNTRIGFIKAAERMNLSAKNLIALLKKEYHLK